MYLQDVLLVLSKKSRTRKASRCERDRPTLPMLLTASCSVFDYQVKVATISECHSTSKLLSSYDGTATKFETVTFTKSAIEFVQRDSLGISIGVIQRMTFIPRMERVRRRTCKTRHCMNVIAHNRKSEIAKRRKYLLVSRYRKNLRNRVPESIFGPQEAEKNDPYIKLWNPWKRWTRQNT